MNKAMILRSSALGLLLAFGCGDEATSPEADEGNGAEGYQGRNPSTLGEESRMVRLSHDQYLNTLVDLLGVERPSTSSLAPDALNGFAFDSSADLRVDSRLGPQYRNQAEALAQQVIEDEALFGRVVPCGSGVEGCSAEFIETFGERAFRRPLTESELTRFGDLFIQAEELIASGDSFRDGVQLVVEAMLQSPQLLYRTETSLGEVIEGREVLSDWEVASRLSYFLYDSMPDAELFEAARQGQLQSPEQVAEAAERMLLDERATAKLSSFHAQAWQFGRYASIAPSAEAFPDLPEGLVDSVSLSSESFVRSVIEEDGGLEELLTAPYAFVDSGLAPLYGLEDSGAEMARVDFPEGERKGLMMQIGFLASNAYAASTDPIHRGLLVVRNLLCRPIPDPPAGAATTPPPESEEPVITTRDEVELLTGQSFCPQCHSQINPPGFAFEGFDAVGQVRELDNGVAVDTTGVMNLDGDEVSFEGPGDMIESVAQSQEARDCYSGRWLQFVFGRGVGDQDLPVLEQLSAQPRSVREMVREVVSSRRFSSRDVNQEAQ